jgi:hypothetical protein
MSTCAIGANTNSYGNSACPAICFNSPYSVAGFTEFPIDTDLTCVEQVAVSTFLKQETDGNIMILSSDINNKQFYCSVSRKYFVDNDYFGRC